MIGIEAPATEVRSACYLLSSEQIDTALGQMERSTGTMLPRQLTVLKLRKMLIKAQIDHLDLSVVDHARRARLSTSCQSTDREAHSTFPSSRL